jgi:cobaltochelatase CobN
MHLLKIDESGALYDQSEAVDLGQPAGDIIVLSSADTEIALLAAATNRINFEHTSSKMPTIRLANYLSLTHPYSVDLYIENTLAAAKLIVVRLLGGSSYWSYGTQQLRALAERSDVQVIFLSGDGKADPELDYLSSTDASECAALSAYLDAGGLDNAVGFLLALRDHLDGTHLAPPPQALMRAGIYWPGMVMPALSSIAAHWVEGAPVAALVFYRALVQAGDLEPIDALINACQTRGLNPLPLFGASLKEAETAAIIADLLVQSDASVILNATSFAISDPSGVAADSQTASWRSAGPFGAIDAPVLQIVLASSRQSDWEASSAGLTARDLAMNVALPELDGRILSRAIGFKRPLSKDPLTHAMTTSYVAMSDRIDFVAELAAGWAKLRQTPPASKKIGLILANYPNRDGRIANGVGLDTPQSAFDAMQLLGANGYDVGEMPLDSAALIAALRKGPTNAGWKGRALHVGLSLTDYAAAFALLPPEMQQDVTARWGKPQADPMCDGTNFRLPILTFGNLAIGVQPARGYNIDPKSTYHAPDLVPPHNYFAFYIWLRRHWQSDALVHFGKHGNLEWLPGKALSLSVACYPEAILGPMPHFYPFIVNDPGEGAQAKRRTAAVILDHLTPPMSKADGHGVMAEVEMQMDEYYEAAGMDKARSDALLVDILATAERAGITADCGIDANDDVSEKLLKLDNFLCDLKEMQIRDGLHIFGASPTGGLADDLLCQILRTPRGDGSGADASLVRALALDLDLCLPDDADTGPFDPLTSTRAMPWNGARPEVLATRSADLWRTVGDTVERLDILGVDIIAGKEIPPGEHSALVINQALPTIRDNLAACGPREAAALLRGLAGKFIPPGASGAPTRGRPEVLPTGRNFFSVDSRALPTPVAWRLGWASAEALLERYLLDHGNWPKSMVLSAWGTANMRTGGDDIAQALALMGVRPEWDKYSRRVTGFEVIPLEILGRPRIDVSLRCSGFFRDAFPAQMSLIDRAVQAIAGLDESDEMNPLAAAARTEQAALLAEGQDEATAKRASTMRIFSAKPGAYGAGLQTLIDEGMWQDRSDFAEAFLIWSSYAYGEQMHGVAARNRLEQRLGAADAVLHNQDNREHDILDSDDYYQFAGGLSAAVSHLSGRDVPVYHNDHSLPERPVIRTLAEEISRVVRGRASNPKWIAGAMRHGYKGAFEMAATVDYLFAFAATTGQVEEHHFTALFEAYIENGQVRDFLEQANDAAYADMLGRFSEAIGRGLWTPRRNSVQNRLDQLRHDIKEPTS